MHYCLNPECTAPVNSNESTVCQNCNTPLLLNNRYIAIKVLGEGGFGRTFLAIDTSPTVPRSCVIKQLFQPIKLHHSSEKVIDLFQQEARQLEKLGQHAHIPSLFDHFEQDGHQYLIQEFIDGQDLRQALKQGKTYSQSRILQLLRKILPTLNFIHKNKVIHRDIKPANIICHKKDNQLFLVDLGAAKQATETALIKTGTVIGSAEYTAPEQAKGKAVFASDIYGLGTTCLNLMTNMSPFDLFDSGTYAWVWRDYLSSPVDDGFAQILDKMIQPATNHRYQSVSKLYADLKEFLNKTQKIDQQQKSLTQLQGDLKSFKASNHPNRDITSRRNKATHSMTPTTRYLEPDIVQNPFLNVETPQPSTVPNLRIASPQDLSKAESGRVRLTYHSKEKRKFSRRIGFATIVVFLLVCVPVALYQTRSHTGILPSNVDEDSGQTSNISSEYYSQIDTDPIPGILNTRFGFTADQGWVPQVHRITQTETGKSIGHVQAAISDLSQLMQIVIPKITGEPASIVSLDQLQFDYGTTLSDDFFVLRYAGLDDLGLGSVQFWSIESSQLTFHFTGGIAFIRDEAKQVGYLDLVDFKVKVYNFATGKHIRDLGIVTDTSHTSPIAVSPNERYLITVSYHNAPGQVPVDQRTGELPYTKEIQVWNLETGKLKQEIDGRRIDYITPKVTFSDNGKQAVVTSTEDGSEIAVIKLP